MFLCIDQARPAFRAPNTNNLINTRPVDDRAVGPRARSSPHGYASATKNSLAQMPRTESPACCPATGRHLASCPASGWAGRARPAAPQQPSQTGDSRSSKEPLIHCVEHAAATRRRSRCGAPTLFQAAPALPPQSAPSRLTPREPRNATHHPPNMHDGQATHAECVVSF